jgi:thioesterase domain-containing protein
VLLGLGLLVGRLSLIDMVPPEPNWAARMRRTACAVFTEANAGHEVNLHRIAHLAELTLAWKWTRPPKSGLAGQSGHALPIEKRELRANRRPSAGLGDFSKPEKTSKNFDPLA